MKMRKNQLGLLFSFFVSILLVGCYTNTVEIEKTTDPVSDYECVVVVDTLRETGYDCMLLAPNDGYIHLMKMYENDNLEEIIILYGDEYKKTAVMRFYENGLLKSVSGDSMTVAFSNYAATEVDIAVIYKDEMQVFKEFEGDVDWGQYILASDSEPTRRLSESQIDALEYFRDQMVNLGEFAVDGHFNPGSGKKIVFDYLTGIVGDTWKLIDNNEESLVTFGFNTVAVAEVSVLLRPVFMAGAAPWVALGTLLLNYYDYVDWVASISYSLLETLDDITSDEELALGTLNSGYGALKATLSWNFYADIDLHAIEPSGYHIYWADKWSSYSDGYLDVDNTAGGSNSKENIYWENPENGTYRFYIDYYGPSSRNYMEQSGVCRVAILYKGQSIGVHNIPMSSGSTNEVQTISLNNGILSRSVLPEINFEIVINRKECKTYK